MECLHAAFRFANLFAIRQFAFYSRPRAVMGFYLEERTQMLMMSAMWAAVITFCMTRWGGIGYSILKQSKLYGVTQQQHINLICCMGVTYVWSNSLWHVSSSARVGSPSVFAVLVCVRVYHLVIECQCICVKWMIVQSVRARVGSYCSSWGSFCWVYVSV